jgi:hypothetical protein
MQQVKEAVFQGPLLERGLPTQIEFSHDIPAMRMRG